MKSVSLHSTLKYTIRYMLLLFLTVTPLVCLGQTPVTSIDSLLKHLNTVTPIYKDTVQEYRASMYVRAFLNLDKKTCCSAIYLRFCKVKRESKNICWKLTGIFITPTLQSMTRRSAILTEL